jgi:hypothetical protein
MMPANMRFRLVTLDGAHSVHLDVVFLPGDKPVERGKEQHSGSSEAEDRRIL